MRLHTDRPRKSFGCTGAGFVDTFESQSFIELPLNFLYQIHAVFVTRMMGCIFLNFFSYTTTYFQKRKDPPAFRNFRSFHLFCQVPSKNRETVSRFPVSTDSVILFLTDRNRPRFRQIPGNTRNRRSALPLSAFR